MISYNNYILYIYWSYNDQCLDMLHLTFFLLAISLKELSIIGIDRSKLTNLSLLVFDMHQYLLEYMNFNVLNWILLLDLCTADESYYFSQKKKFYFLWSLLWIRSTKIRKRSFSIIIRLNLHVHQWLKQSRYF